MVESDAEFMKHLLGTFKVEADEHLRNITSGLVELEKAGAPEQRTAMVEVVFREAHSLKGAARSVNLVDIEGLCQAMEGGFAAMKRQELEGSTELFDLLQQAADHLDRLLAAVGGEPSAEGKSLLHELVNRLEGAVTSGSAAVVERRSGEAAPPEEASPLPSLSPAPVQTVQEAPPIREASPVQAPLQLKKPHLNQRGRFPATRRRY